MPTNADTPAPAFSPLLLIRAAFAGALMGLANLVPGISGGTMLLAAGVYQRFIDAIADVTSLRFKPASILLLATIVIAALLAIVILAGTIADLVVNHPWVMFSLFIGLTLGGVPLVWKMARPATTPVWIGLAAGLVAMVALALLQMQNAGAASPQSSTLLMMFLAGLAGASAMILPGVSGGYLLLVLGVYVPLLNAIDRCKAAVSDGDLSALLDEWRTVVPVALGVLMGLLLGAVVGLWPFQKPVPPQPGDTINATLVTEENIPDLLDDPAKWPIQYFTPSPIQILGSLACIAAGFTATLAIARLGNAKPKRN